MENMESTENFQNLPPEKQRVIINAALHAFGLHGYKKASVADIAQTAGISKAMIFHYFTSKKNLYLYLIKISSEVLISGVMSKMDKDENDFFKRIRNISEMKISVLEEYPDIYTFMECMFFEAAPEVAPEISRIMLRKNENLDITQFFDGVDYSKFKENIEPLFVVKILMYISEGCIKQKSENGKMNIEAIMQEYDECLALFKNNFYRKECLKEKSFKQEFVQSTNSGEEDYKNGKFYA